MYKRQDGLGSRLCTPSPALSPGQRYHFETHGYVIIEQVFTDSEVEELKAAVFDVHARFARNRKDPTLHGVCEARFTDRYKRLDGMGFAHARLLDFNCHPLLIGMAEEVTGSAVRVNETTAIINAGNPERAKSFSWHRGADAQVSCHTKHDLFHCNFVKTLVNLTDFGPDDGGTVCLPGSHKLDVHRDELAQIANANPHLVHQFIAPKGSVFLFAESLLHSTGHNRSEHDRMLLISSFCSRYLPNWDRYDGLPPYEDENLMRSFPEHIRLHLRGFADWTRGQRYRHSLLQEAEACDRRLRPWQDLAAEAADPVGIVVDAR